MSPRRSSKEPVLPNGSPLLPIVDQLRSMARGLTETAMPDVDDETKAHVRGKVEGLESAITLLRRAGASGVTLEGGQHLVKLERAPEDASLAARVARLEREVQAMRGTAPAPRALKVVPAILEKPAARDATWVEKETELSKVGRCARKLLAVLALRTGTTSARQLSILSGYSVRSSSFANGRSLLRSRGLIEGDAGGMRITIKGRALVGSVPPLPTGKELLAHWCAELPAAERSLLAAIARSPDGLEKAALAEATGYSITSSSFANAVSTLRTLELIDRGWPARAAAMFTEDAS